MQLNESGLMSYRLYIQIDTIKNNVISISPLL